MRGASFPRPPIQLMDDGSGMENGGRWRWQGGWQVGCEGTGRGMAGRMERGIVGRLRPKNRRAQDGPVIILMYRKFDFLN